LKKKSIPCQGEKWRPNEGARLSKLSWRREIDQIAFIASWKGLTTPSLESIKKNRLAKEHLPNRTKALIRFYGKKF